MVKTALVKIWGDTVGAVAWDDTRQLGSFEYDPGFVRKGYELAPLKMPLTPGRIFSFPELRKSRNQAFDTYKGLPGLLADSLPDKYGNQLINAWLAKNGRQPDSMNAVEQLCFIGTRGMGALEFEPATFSTNQVFDVEIDSLVQTAQKLLSERQDVKIDLNQAEEKAMRDILKIGTSAGGARPKALIAFNEQTGEVRSGQTDVPAHFDHWLIKLDGVSDVQFGESLGYGRVEQAYHKMAMACGIDMMPSRLLEENGRAHFMTKRFDRGSGNTKHHVQTWCAISHVDFNDVTSYSYEQLFQTLRELHLPYPAAEQLYRRMVFNVLARNCDDHSKNFAFLLTQEGRWTLAPAYDLCHAYRPDSLWVSQHALSVNGKRRNITRQDLEAVAKAMNIKKAAHIIYQIDQVIQHWPDYADEQHVAADKRDTIGTTLVRMIS